MYCKKIIEISGIAIQYNAMPVNTLKDQINYGNYIRPGG